MSDTLVTRYLRRAKGLGVGGWGLAVGAQDSTPYPFANDLMLTYSDCRLLLLFRSISFPAAPLNLIKKLPPPMQMRRGQGRGWQGKLELSYANYKCCRVATKQRKTCKLFTLFTNDVPLHTYTHMCVCPSLAMHEIEMMWNDSHH